MQQAGLILPVCVCVSSVQNSKLKIFSIPWQNAKNGNPLTVSQVPPVDDHFDREHALRRRPGPKEDTSIEEVNTPTMEDGNGVTNEDGVGGASGEGIIADKVSISAPEEDVALATGATVPEATRQEPFVPNAETEGYPEEDVVKAPPVRRKSHRPSLEVVEVKMDSFYDKADFKRDLQVKRGGGRK